jgi:hypothetical protein
VWRPPEVLRLIAFAPGPLGARAQDWQSAGSAAALWANHRSSYAHSQRPLEVAEVTLPSGHVLRVPTADETLRIKGYLVVRRNQVRDYIDVAAASDRCGIFMPQMCSGISTITILTSEVPKQRVSLPSSLGSWPIHDPQMLGRSSKCATTKTWIPGGLTGGMSLPFAGQSRWRWWHDYPPEVPQHPALLNSSREWSAGPARWLPIRSAPRWPLRSGIWSAHRAYRNRISLYVWERRGLACPLTCPARLYPRQP